MATSHLEKTLESDSDLRIGLALQDTGWHPGSWFRIPETQEVFTSQYWADLALTAEAGGLDFVTFEDSLGLQRHGQLDASLVTAWLGAGTQRIGLIPTLTTTHTEPFHLSKNLATLDFISTGRAGWQVAVSRSEAESQLFGRGRAPGPLSKDPDSWLAELYAESEEAVDVVRRLWDSWEDGAEIRDTDTGRFIDRNKVHYINYEGKHFSVKGPSITPRPPQGQPVVLYQGNSAPVIKAAATSADVLVVEAQTPNLVAELIETARDTERTSGRSGTGLKVYAEITVLVDDTDEAANRRLDQLDSAHGHKWSGTGGFVVGSAEKVADAVAAYQDSGISGLRLKPAEHSPDVSSIADLLIPELTGRGIFTPNSQPDTLRHRLGLGPAPNRYSLSKQHEASSMVGDRA